MTRPGRLPPSMTRSEATGSGPAVLLRDDAAGREMAFSDPLDLIRADTPEEVAEALDAMAAAQDAGHWCAGYLSYEAGYTFDPKLWDYMPDGRRVPLILMGVFDAPRTGPVTRQINGSASLTHIRPDWSLDDYAPRFRRLHQHLRQGDCYQGNLTFPFSAHWQGDPRTLFEAMTDRQPVRYGSLVDLGGPVVLSRSPELFFDVDEDGWIETHPMKGTTRRGATPEEDARLAEELRSDEKNRSENLMIVDLLRNDMSRISELGTLEVPELFRIESYPTVQQMVSRVRARLAPGVTLSDIFRALFPCGSITGAPKIRAMQILSSLETRPRDAYCGAIGFVSPQGQMRFNVAIRTMTLFPGGEAVFNAGGGIVFDSNMQAEYEEALLKAQFASLDGQTR